MQRMMALAAATFVILAATAAPAAEEIRPIEQLLPPSTTGYLCISDVDRLGERFDSTQIGKLMSDPVMEPFRDDLREQLQDRWTRLRNRLGLKLSDLDGVATGEAGVALLLPTADEAAVALVIDVTGNLPKAEALVEKASANQIAQGAKRSEVKIEGIDDSVIRFDLAAKPDDPKILPKKAFYLLTNNWLVASDELEVIEDVVARILGKETESLATVGGFRAVMDRCAKDSDGATPQIRWWIDPLGYVATVRIITPEDKRRKGKSLLETFQNQGFGAIKGIGGYFDFATGGFEWFHRTMIYAPPPYENAMQMAVFPNGPEFAPQRWVPRDIASYTTFYVDILNAFDHFGPLFDEMFGQPQFLFKVPAAGNAAKLDAGEVPQPIVDELDELDISLSSKAKLVVKERGNHWEITDTRKVFDDIREEMVDRESVFIIRRQDDELNVYEVYTGLWNEILRSLKEDPYGPKIDLRADLIQHLGQRVTILTDYKLPITPTSERLLFAIEVSDAEKVAAAIEKTMKDDPTVKRREIDGQIIWEIVEEEPEEVPGIEIDLPSLSPEDEPAVEEPEPEEDRQLLPHAAVTVAHDHLLVASHLDFLLEVLEPREARDTLARSIAYRLVDGKLETLGIEQQCARIFSRTDETLRPTYELIRQGKMPQAETLLGRILNSLLGSGEEDEPREQRIEGEKLPDYEVVRRSLGPRGAVVVNESDGWFLRGVLISKDAP